MKFSLKCFLTVIIMNGTSAMINFSDTNCGSITQTRTGRIVGGRDTNPGEYPWLVSITRRGGHFCGGSIIHKKYILTAGHCLCGGTNMIQAQQLHVTIGQYNLANLKSNAYEIGVKTIHIHPAYKCSKVSNDLALLELSRDIEWADNIAPACLPIATGENDYNRYDNVVATVAGWGWLHEDTAKGGRATVLQKANVNVIENETCQKWYKSQGKKTKIHNTQICAGFEQGGIDSCWADSGGPLMIENGNRLTVVGVVSTGIGCARPYLPGLYTRLSEYIPWIRSVVNAGS